MLSRKGLSCPRDFFRHVQVADQGGEADRKDEAICPTDMNLMCDDDLRTILAPLPPTVKFTMIADCCHSGSLLDHPVQQISGNKDPNAPPVGADAMDPSQLMGMFFKGAPVCPPTCPHEFLMLYL
jgi:hypothetical protein